MDFNFKDHYDISDLLHIVEILRAPGGCPWDREQTHESLRQDLIEEAYEVVDGIDSGDPAALREELGDLLLQVVFHSSLSRQEGSFDFDDVCDEICHKMIIRHPHVFGSVEVSGTGEVLKNWERIKQDTKHQKSVSETLESVPKCFPALMRAAKLSKRTPGALEDKQAALELFRSETAAPIEGEESFGRMLFAAAYYAKASGVDPEEALAAYCDRYVKNYAAFEKHSQDGISVEKTLKYDE